jgi:Xaa-Pro aminopeptidase
LSRFNHREIVTNIRLTFIQLGAEYQMTTDSHSKRLSLLRKNLKKLELDGFIVPRTDEFQGEYVSASSERLVWLTGFSGSAGSAIVEMKSAALFVDGRYTIQAARETKGLDITLLPLEAISMSGFMAKAFKPKARIGYDPWLSTVQETKRLQTMAVAGGLTLVPLSANPIDDIWTDRPQPPNKPVRNHPEKYAGVAATDKLNMIAKAISAAKADVVVLADPLIVAWTFNIRGSDIPHTPAALLRAIVTKGGKATLYVEAARLDKAVVTSLGKTVTAKSPEKLTADLKALGKQKNRVMLDPAQCPEAIRVALQSAGAAVIEANDPCTLPRARKNGTEQNGSRNAHIRDGAAMCSFLCWLEQQTPNDTLTEFAVQEKLLAYRQASGKLLDLSFSTISASGPNAAQPHYKVENGKGRKLRNGEIYLIDSGGQYIDGTTDITRTTIMGEPTDQMRKHFTLVLKGMIAVSVARFPMGTTGTQLDALARAALWQHGYDFDHGTGHGVGSYLSVHEGPARISKAGQVALEPGMILSNEPGYYLQGKYGIRIENLLVVKPATKIKNADRAMLSFETLSFAPIEKRLIDTALLTRAELQWIDSYHALVVQKLEQKLDAETRIWLEQKCAPLT